MANFETVATLGAGVIGASWTALFLAGGLRVQVYDPADPDGERLRTYIDNAWPALTALGLTGHGDADNLQMFTEAAAAVEGAGFVQESVPEQLELKHALYAEIEPALGPDAIVASSASGLLLREMQRGWRDPSRFILGHPFNPPHLIPLVELLANEATADGVLEAAEAFYARIGKVTIRVNKEVPAHIANRLQAALWREAISLVQNGVASVEDVDKAVWAGPGLRWAAMGPHMLFHLGAGAGGLLEFCNRYRDSFHRWWDDLEDLRLDESIAQRLFEGVTAESSGEPVQSIAAERDALIVEFLRGRKALAQRK
jgi:3-hydroxybutyryl-CoA dehydrogenase